MLHGPPVRPSSLSASPVYFNPITEFISLKHILKVFHAVFRNTTGYHAQLGAHPQVCPKSVRNGAYGSGVKIAIVLDFLGFHCLRPGFHFSWQCYKAAVKRTEWVEQALFAAAIASGIIEQPAILICHSAGIEPEAGIIHTIFITCRPDQGDRNTEGSPSQYLVYFSWSASCSCGHVRLA